MIALLESRRGLRSTLATVFAIANIAVASAASDPVVGSGKGLDHVGIAVADLAAAQRDFAALGFQIEPGGRHPGGTENAAISFANKSYIELISIAKRTKDDADYAAFIQAGDGAEFFGLETSDANASVAALRRRHIEVSDPQPGTITPQGMKLSKPPPPFWYGFGITEKSWSSDPSFFIQYLRANERAFQAEHPETKRWFEHDLWTRHPNSALGLRAVWMLAADPAHEAQRYLAAGFQRGPAVSLGPPFNVQGVSVVVADTRIAFIPESAAAASRVKAHAGVEPIVLIQLDAADLGRALASSHGSRSSLDRRMAVLVPPDHAHGVWLAFTAPPNAAAQSAP